MTEAKFIERLKELSKPARARVLVAIALRPPPKRRLRTPASKRDQELLTTTQAAKLIGASASSVKCWVAAGLIPIATHAGCRKGRRLLRRADVLAFDPPRARTKSLEVEL